MTYDMADTPTRSPYAEDEEIAQRVRRLDAAMQRHFSSQQPTDPEADELWRNLWTEYWGPGAAVEWLLGRNTDG
jgi:hypothetical protein